MTSPANSATEARVVNIPDAFNSFQEHWSPRIVAEANGQFFKIAKVQGEFVAHRHAEEDEAFLCVRGRFGLRFHSGRHSGGRFPRRRILR